MKPFVALLLVALSIFVGVEITFFPVQTKVTARAGQLDLRTQSLSSKTIIPLTGQWTFYPNQLLTPRDLLNGLAHNKMVRTVPQVWGQGYGTYQLEVQLSPLEQQFLNAIYVPSISSAYRMWVNGREVRTAGLIGTTRSTMRPQDNPGIIAVASHQSSKVDIVIEVSNFIQSKGGIGEKLLLGNLRSLLRYHDINLFIELFIVGSLFITGLYYILFYWGRPSERYSLYYALLCGDVAVQTFFLDSSNITTLVPRLGWIAETRLQYLSGSIGLVLVILVTMSLYPRDSRRVANWLFISLGGLFSIFFLTTPPWIFTASMNALNLLITLAVCYLLFVFVRAVTMGRENAVVNLISLLFFAASIVNDILYYSNVIQSGNLVPEGLFMFVLIQTMTFSRKYAQAMFDLKRNTQALSVLNDELELRIQGRTRELEDTMAELQQTNVRLEHLLMSDSLTTIPNRRYFEITIEKMWHDLAKNRGALAILLIDVDFFKQYNDNYGHVQGDLCLREVAKTLEAHLIPYIGSFVARIGGEEFAVAIPQAESETVSALAERLRHLIMNLQLPHAGSGIHDFVTVSIGWVRANAISSVDVWDLFRNADDALYQAKREGRNRTIMFDWGAATRVETAGGLDGMNAVDA